MKKFFTLSVFVSVFVFNCFSSFAQVAVNSSGNSADNSAMLDISSSTKGMLVPRMTTTQRSAISSPATGLIVFDINENNFYFYSGSEWTLIKSGVVLWNLSGTSLTVADTTYKVGIGTTTPSGQLEVASVKQTGTYGSDVCTGGTASASSTYSTYTADKAFNDNTADFWLNNKTMTTILAYDLGEGNEKRVGKYRIYFSDPVNQDHSPDSWDFEGSNDSTTWVTLDSQTGQGWSDNSWKEYAFYNTTWYRYYRIKITNNKGDSDKYVQINEMEMMEENLKNSTLFVNDNKVGIGTSSPSASLDVSGTFQFTDGNEAAGRILSSDASGNASWTDGATLNGGGWTLSGNYIYNNGDSVGIGTSSPNALLEVNGDIVVGTGTGIPVTGTIRWNSTIQDFEGYNGSKWVSFTRYNGGWGDNSTHETESITVSDGAEEDYFGNSVSVDGNNAIVGAYYKDIGGNSHQGKAYIFHRGTGTSWFLDAELTASDGAASDGFGYSVSIDGDYAVVGAYLKDVGGNSEQGKAYIFKNFGTAWVETASLTASDGTAGDHFGASVSIQGDNIVVGADRKNVDGNQVQGKVYIFNHHGSYWNEQAGLTASDGAAGDNFGTSVSICGNYIVVGAPDKSVGGNFEQGKAYIFKNNILSSWTEQAGLTASDGSTGDKFGSHVSTDGNYTIVGAPQCNSRGKAYIFHRSGTAWSEQAGLTASDESLLSFFGISVSIDDENAVVGASGKITRGNYYQGKAYIFHRNGTIWSEQAGLTASDGAQEDYFGFSVSISGDYIVVGAIYKDVGGNSKQGKVYFFERNQ